MRKNIALVVGVALLAIGCSTPVTLQTTGGSRADGIVVMTGDYGLWKGADIQKRETMAKARQTCAGWGYSDAQPFDTYRTYCAAETPVGCASTRIEMKFQCTNGSPAFMEASDRSQQTRSALDKALDRMDAGVVACQVDSDCPSTSSCRSRRGGGTMCVPVGSRYRD